MTSLPATVSAKFKSFFDNIGNSITSFKDGVKEWFLDIGGKILSLPDKIIGGIKRIFIPRDGFIEEQIDSVEESLGRIGIGVYKMDDIFSTSKGIKDINVSVMGSKGTIFRSDIL